MEQAFFLLSKEFSPCPPQDVCRNQDLHGTVMSCDGTKPCWCWILTEPLCLMFFLFRAAQKLSLSRRKKSQPGPPSSPDEAPRTLVYTRGFSGALQLSPPAVPPCLLRAGSKVKDTPGMGKVSHPECPAGLQNSDQLVLRLLESHDFSLTDQQGGRLWEVGSWWVGRGRRVVWMKELPVREWSSW